MNAPLAGVEQLNVLVNSRVNAAQQGFHEAAEHMRERCGESFGPTLDDEHQALLFDYRGDWLHFCVKVAVCSEKTLSKEDMSGAVRNAKEWLQRNEGDDVVKRFRTAMQKGVQGDSFRAYALVGGSSMEILDGGAILALVHVFNPDGADFGSRFARTPARETTSLQMWHKYAHETMVQGLDARQLAALKAELATIWTEHQQDVCQALLATYPKVERIGIEASEDTPEDTLAKREQ